QPGSAVSVRIARWRLVLIQSLALWLLSALGRLEKHQKRDLRINIHAARGWVLPDLQQAFCSTAKRSPSNPRNGAKWSKQPISSRNKHPICGPSSRIQQQNLSVPGTSSKSAARPKSRWPRAPSTSRDLLHSALLRKATV